MIEHSPFTIGRVAGSDLLLQDPYISQRHAEFVAENGDFFIVDKVSRHGTFLNGERLTNEERQQLKATILSTSALSRDPWCASACPEPNPPLSLATP
jgi:pSer/pThr/pTyr-binding forkhead associated (FHA) protein